MFDDPSELPCPRLTIHVDVPADLQAEVDLTALPTKAGVFALEDGDGRTSLLAITANLRRMVKSRLAETSREDERAGPRRRVDYRSITRAVRAVTVGSDFEGEWAYLQLARRCMTASYRGSLDRWRGWFVHCDPDAKFPRFVKTNQPGAPPEAGAGSGVFLGPMPDKHAAGRYIEMLQSVFDLCRHHSILVQAPDATACAYKEMGRCPAPCDGSVTLDSYREQIRNAIEFASSPVREWREDLEPTMKEAAERLDYETAQRCRRQLADTAVAMKPKFEHVDRIERFRFVAVLPAEHPERARMFVIRGGWIAPVVDVPLAAFSDELKEVAEVLCEQLKAPWKAVTDEAGENIGLVCRHLFRPRKAKRPGIFLRCADGVVQAGDLAGALRKVNRAADSESQVAEVSLEG